MQSKVVHEQFNKLTLNYYFTLRSAGETALPMACTFCMRTQAKRPSVQNGHNTKTNSIRRVKTSGRKPILRAHEIQYVQISFQMGTRAGTVISKPRLYVSKALSRVAIWVIYLEVAPEARILLTVRGATEAFGFRLYEVRYSLQPSCASLAVSMARVQPSL